MSLPCVQMGVVCEVCTCWPFWQNLWSPLAIGLVPELFASYVIMAECDVVKDIKTQFNIFALCYRAVIVVMWICDQNLPRYIDWMVYILNSLSKWFLVHKFCYIFKVEAILKFCSLKQVFFRYNIAVWTNEGERGGGIESPHCQHHLTSKS